MTGKRCYKQYCGLAKALDVIGERWTLLILRDLMLGPWRYSDLLERMPGITTNMLATRLKEMEQQGLIVKVEETSLGSSHRYELSELGKQLEPAMLSLSRFGFNFMDKPPGEDEAVDPGRALLNLKNRYQGKAKGLITFKIRNEFADNVEETYQVSFSSDGVEIQHGQPLLPDTIVELGLKTYSAVVFRGASVQNLEEEKKIKITGSRVNWEKFKQVFGLS
ncbi:MAG: helix-turn-helix domain-containing protein [Gammaproteobacteria bacterium]|nr:helix-turn-helix domain-containing protein [Gammaproteobacteria bacterium]